MKKVILLIFTVFTAVYSYAQKEEIIYYDADGNGVETEDLASIVRHAYYAKDANYANRFKDYSKSGQLLAEGVFTSIDKYNYGNCDIKTSKQYDENGTVRATTNKNGNKIDVIQFNSNGTKSLEASYVNDKLEGLVKQYGPEGDIWIEQYFKDGEVDASRPFYVTKTTDGIVTKFDSYTNKKQDIAAPTSADYSVLVSDGKSWQTIIKNGFKVSVTADTYTDSDISADRKTSFKERYKEAIAQYKKNTTTGIFNKFIRVVVDIRNCTPTPVTFDTNQIVSNDISEKKPKPVEYISYDTYVSGLSNTISTKASQNAANERALAREIATTSSSSSSSSQSSSSLGMAQTNAAYASRSGVVGAVVGGSASAGGLNNRAFSNSISNANSDSNSMTRDANIYYQGMKDAQENIDKYNSNLANEQINKQEAYLHPLSIAPLSRYIGYIYTTNMKLTDFTFVIKLEGIDYPFEFKFNNAK